MADIFGGVSSAKQLWVLGWWVRWSPCCGQRQVGRVEPLLWAEAGGGTGLQRQVGAGLQRQVGAVVPSLPDGTVISWQSPLQVGHGHRFLEVNHGIGV